MPGFLRHFETQRQRLFRTLALLGLLLALLGSAPPPSRAALSPAGVAAGAGSHPPARIGTPLLVDVIVQGASGDYLTLLVEAHGGQVTRDLGVIGSVAARVPADRIAALEREPGVTRVWQNAVVRSS